MCVYVYKCVCVWESMCECVCEYVFTHVIFMEARIYVRNHPQLLPHLTLRTGLSIKLINMVSSLASFPWPPRLGLQRNHHSHWLLCEILGIWTPVLMLAKQALYHGASSSSVTFSISPPFSGNATADGQQARLWDPQLHHPPCPWGRISFCHVQGLFKTANNKVETLTNEVWCI